MKTDKLPVGETITFAFRFGTRAIPTLMRLGWLPLALMVGGFALVGWGLADTPMMAAKIGFGGILTLAGTLLFVPIYVILIREAAGGYKAPPGLFVLSFGGREARVLGAAFILGFVFLVVVVGFQVAKLAIGAVASFVVGDGVLGLILSVVITLAWFVGIAWFYCATITFVPMAATENRIALTEAFAATKDNVWRILACVFVVFGTLFVLAILIQLMSFAMTGGLMAVGSEVALASIVYALLTVVVFLALQIYQTLVGIALPGRITGALRGTPDDAVEDVFA
ncbi:hypothetical protein [Parvularcula dongshanensis]|uniref:Glycerophosphoryl diester phosphodiesterase membrane domain-containing protein n=1 Tax=Parvularcula dongshanensis TaxID=1173995 RepID=A0A840I6R0_9PROT|nr:hypothetical protein [Parvularcula dongshanensis]MBB4659995.1 hypothetical protein [Parvularcula dongshanensis]